MRRTGREEKGREEEKEGERREESDVNTRVKLQ